MLVKNKISLKEKYPYILNNMEDIINIDDFIEITRNGEKTLNINNLYIHSRYSPIKEAEKIATNMEEHDLFIFAGFGLGYVVEKITNKFPDSKIIVFEPNYHILSMAFVNIDQVNIINNSRILFSTDLTLYEISNYLLVNKPDRVKYVPLNNRTKLGNKDFILLEELVNNYVIKKEINRLTQKKFERVWVKNILRNINTISSYGPDVDELKKLSNLPCLLVCAGPSLELIIPNLSTYKKKFIIIAVDTAFSSLMDEQIEPDIVISIDPQYWNSRHLEGRKPEKTILIADPAIQNSGLRSFYERTIFIHSPLKFWSYLSKDSGELAKFSGGGSVSTTALDIAIKIGLKPIYIIGLDLSYPGGITHYKNSFFEKKMLMETTRLNTIDHQSFSYINKGFPYKVLSNLNKTIVSDKRMKVYLNWFEDKLKNNPIPIYNLSSIGCKIENLPYITPLDIESFTDIRNIIDHKIADLSKVKKIDLNTIMQNLDNFKIKLLKMLHFCNTKDYDKLLYEAREIGIPKIAQNYSSEFESEKELVNDIRNEIIFYLRQISVLK
jgi:hypothetical protein